MNDAPRLGLLLAPALLLLSTRAPSIAAQEGATPAAASAPTPRAGHCLVYDAERRKVILLSGQQPPDLPALDEVWAWDGKTWEHLAGTGPVARSLSAATWDSRKKRVVLHGGVGNEGYESAGLGDTWEWDGARWSQLADTATGSRDHHVMVFDEARGVRFLYGGQTGERTMDTRTWTSDGTSWSSVAVPGPGARVHFAMAYDAKRERVVLFGGASDGRTMGDTWEWDGVHWTRVATQGPPARSAHRMVYDARDGVVVLHGGGASRDDFDDTWVWDGEAWLDTGASGTGGRSLHAMAYDAARERVVLYGGLHGGFDLLADTWEWDGSGWKRVDKG